MANIASVWGLTHDVWMELALHLLLIELTLLAALRIWIWRHFDASKIVPAKTGFLAVHDLWQHSLGVSFLDNCLDQIFQLAKAQNFNQFATVRVKIYYALYNVFDIVFTRADF